MKLPHRSTAFIQPTSLVNTVTLAFINNQRLLFANPQPFTSISSSNNGLVSSSVSVLTTLPSLLTSVKVFDGSEITDTIVVSNSFWSNLSSKLPGLLLAELLASITFVVIVSTVAAQSKFVFDQALSNKNSTTFRKKTQFRKANEKPPPTPQIDLSKLLVCILIDIIGSANEVVPVFGELVDIVYAPIAALLLRQLFAGSNIVFLLELVEEILPFTDILPLATICWTVETFFGDGNLAKVLRIGEFAPDKVAGGDVIGVDGAVNEYEIEEKTTLQLKSAENMRDDNYG